MFGLEYKGSLLCFEAYTEYTESDVTIGYEISSDPEPDDLVWVVNDKSVAEKVREGPGPKGDENSSKFNPFWPPWIERNEVKVVELTKKE